MSHDDEDSTQIVQLLSTDVIPDRPKDRCTLVVLSGPNPGRVITAEEEELVIGRGPTASARIEDTGLSRMHARVFRRGEHWYVEDLGSTNGTWIGGNAVNTPQVVSDGDRLLVGQSTLLRVTIQDEVEQEAAKRTYESTVRDALTRVYNRRHLDAQMRTEFAYSLRHGSDLSILVIDIDHFKGINDSLGHLAGDEVLKAVAQSLARMVRTEDMVARYGGEEFVVVARGINSANAMILAERVRARVQGLAIRYQDTAVPVTVSLGVATLSKNAAYKDVAEFFAAADEALYTAKKAGRNRVVHAG
ncbi:MAG: GGDEF domain-containing protein [Polyangiales bacterium]